MESFDKLGLPPLESSGIQQEGSNKPLRKTTSKTEVSEPITSLTNNYLYPNYLDRSKTVICNT